MPTLSEAESKRLLAAFGVPVVTDRVVADPEGAAAAAAEFGGPVVVKLCGATIAHKTERGLVRLGVEGAAVLEAAAELLAAARPDDGDVSLLVAPMVRGTRELIAGLHRDPQFGMTVMLGIGGVLAEALGDVAFRLVPLEPVDATELIEDLATQSLLGAFRGEPAVDRDPPAGGIGIVSQSGNLTSSLMNLACHHGVGVSRAVSAGNAAAVTVADYLEYYADDPHTAVGLVYVEEVGDGREFFTRLRAVCERMPVVVLKGGASAGGARAAASHTGSLASDDRIFEGACRQAGAIRAAGIEEAYEAAATFATQPRPDGPRVAVVTTAGGWGVVTADTVARTPDLELAPLPDDLRAALDAELPPRWSRNNPIDLAGGESKDTVPRVLELVTRHPGVDAVVFLGLGIQGNQGRLEREGPFFPGHGLDRIVAYHDRQERRYAETAAALARDTGKPVLSATELALGDTANPAVAGVRESGMLCYPSAQSAVTALAHLWRSARWRRRRGL